MAWFYEFDVKTRYPEYYDDPNMWLQCYYDDIMDSYQDECVKYYADKHQIYFPGTPPDWNLLNTELLALIYRHCINNTDNKNTIYAQDAEDTNMFLSFALVCKKWLKAVLLIPSFIHLGIFHSHRDYSITSIDNICYYEELVCGSRNLGTVIVPKKPQEDLRRNSRVAKCQLCLDKEHLVGRIIFESIDDLRHISSDGDCWYDVDVVLCLICAQQLWRKKYNRLIKII